MLLTIFILGFIFGIASSVIALIYLLSNDNPFPFLQRKRKNKKKDDSDLNDDNKTLHKKYDAAPSETLKVTRLKEILDFLEEVNFPIKKLSKDIGNNENQPAVDNSQWLESKMKVIVDGNIVAKAEKELSECIASMKEHRQHLKLLTTFISDISKALSNFAKELSKLSTQAKSYTSSSQRDSPMNDTFMFSSNPTSKDGSAANSWWQTMTLFLENLVHNICFLFVLKRYLLINCRQITKMNWPRLLWTRSTASYWLDKKTCMEQSVRPIQKAARLYR